MSQKKSCGSTSASQNCVKGGFHAGKPHGLTASAPSTVYPLPQHLGLLLNSCWHCFQGAGERSRLFLSLLSTICSPSRVTTHRGKEVGSVWYPDLPFWGARGSLRSIADPSESPSSEQSCLDRPPEAQKWGRFIPFPSALTFLVFREDGAASGNDSQLRGGGEQTPPKVPEPRPIPGGCRRYGGHGAAGPASRVSEKAEASPVGFVLVSRGRSQRVRV